MPETNREPAVVHGTFELERILPAHVGHAFAAWSDPAVKARWFANAAEFSLDFRVDGLETVRRCLADGRRLRYEASYRDIVVERRIVYHSALWTDERLSTVSLTTVTFDAEGAATRLTLVEQGAFLDGLEDPSWREHGTARWLDALRRMLSHADEAA